MNKTDLLKSAIHSKQHSYSPYSEFSVGAAVITEDGSVFQGTNIENSSYGLSICAERVAIFSAIAAGHKVISSLAVSCPESQDKNSLMPCGACLQVMSEFGAGDMSITIDNLGEFELKQLLPTPFKI